MRADAAPLRRFPRDSAGAAAVEVILALVAADRGARPFENGFGPWTVRGGLQAALEKNRSFQGPVAALGGLQDRRVILRPDRGGDPAQAGGVGRAEREEVRDDQAAEPPAPRPPLAPHARRVVGRLVGDGGVEQEEVADTSAAVPHPPEGVAVAAINAEPGSCLTGCHRRISRALGPDQPPSCQAPRSRRMVTSCPRWYAL